MARASPCPWSWPGPAHALVPPPPKRPPPPPPPPAPCPHPLGSELTAFLSRPPTTPAPQGPQTLPRFWRFWSSPPKSDFELPKNLNFTGTPKFLRKARFCLFFAVCGCFLVAAGMRFFLVRRASSLGFPPSTLPSTVLHGSARFCTVLRHGSAPRFFATVLHGSARFCTVHGVLWCARPVFRFLQVFLHFPRLFHGFDDFLRFLGDLSVRAESATLCGFSRNYRF